MSQDEYIRLLFDKCDFSELSIRSLLERDYGVKSIEDLPKHKKSHLIEYLKEMSEQ